MLGSKGNTVAPAGNIEEAEDIFSGLAPKIYALDDIARRLADCSLNAFTIRLAVGGIVDGAIEELNGALALVPDGGDACMAAHEAIEALDAMKEFLEAVIGDDWRTTEKVAGSVLLDMAIRAAKEIERAEIACGATFGTMGYLAGEHSESIDPNRLNPPIAAEGAPGHA